MAKEAKSCCKSIKERVDKLEAVMEAYVSNLYKYGKTIEELEVDLGIVKADLSSPAEEVSYDEEEIEIYETLIKDVEKLKSKMGL